MNSSRIKPACNHCKKKAFDIDNNRMKRIKVFPAMVLNVGKIKVSVTEIEHKVWCTDFTYIRLTRAVKCVM